MKVNTVAYANPLEELKSSLWKNLNDLSNLIPEA